jgi:hypothetical protein
MTAKPKPAIPPIPQRRSAAFEAGYRDGLEAPMPPPEVLRRVAEFLATTDACKPHLQPTADDVEPTPAKGNQHRKGPKI